MSDSAIDNQSSASTTKTGSQPKYWQVLGGTEDRDFIEYFLKYGLAFVGGELYERRMQQVAEGDIIILKKGGKTIVAAGTVIKGNDGYVSFGEEDIKGVGPNSPHPQPWLYHCHGWEMPAFCHVKWYKPPSPKTDVVGLASQTTLCNFDNPSLIQEAVSIIKTDPIFPSQPPPHKTNPVTDNTIITSLVRKGFRADLAVSMADTMRKIRLLAQYYYHEVNWGDVGEHEARSYLVLPLLYALGWSEQQMKIEYRLINKTDIKRADIAGFPGPFISKSSKASGADSCCLLVETKALDHGPNSACKQVEEYAALTSGDKVVAATNGLWWQVGKMAKDDTQMTDVAYFNILDPQDACPLDPGNVGGCIEAIELLRCP